jgi:general transcription factor 3C polypeptide 5 (transcription factor C subunit 1)
MIFGPNYRSLAATLSCLSGRSPDKALESLGGLNNIGLVLSEPNRRLELRFRPEDIFSKPACGEPHHCTC